MGLHPLGEQIGGRLVVRLVADRENAPRGPHDRLLSFGQLAGSGDAAHLVAALVTSPAQAKVMSQALATAVARHEEQFGPLAAPGVRGRDARAATASRRAPKRSGRAAKKG